MGGYYLRVLRWLYWTMASPSEVSRRNCNCIVRSKYVTESLAGFWAGLAGSGLELAGWLDPGKFLAVWVVHHRRKQLARRAREKGREVDQQSGGQNAVKGL